MIPPRPARARAVLLSGLLALALLLPGLGATRFDDPGEGQHAEIAREAWTTGDWLTLRLNGVRYLDKPPLLYAAAAAAFSLWGPSEWTARLPSLVGAVLTVTATALLGARLLGPAAGFVAGGALLSCALFAAFACYVRPEMLFLAAIQWGFLGLLYRQPFETLSPPGGEGRVRGERINERSPGHESPARGEGSEGSEGSERPRIAWAWPVIGCVALGLASLAKDPLGLLGPLAAVAFALALAGRLRPISKWVPAAGVIALLLVGFGWHALAAARNAGFLWYTVVDNHLLNAARLRFYPDEDVPLSAIEFLLVASMGAFPWVIGAALMVGRLVRHRAWRDAAEAPWVALAVWSVGVFVIFTLIPFRLPHYGLPAYPALALLAARWWLTEGPRARLVLAAHAMVLSALALLFRLAILGDGRSFSDLVLATTDVATRKAGAAGEVIPGIAWSDLSPLIGHGALVLTVGAAGLALATYRRAARLGLAIMLATMLALVPMVKTGLGLVSSGREVSGMASEVARRAAAGDLVLHEGPIEQSGALEFYSGRRPVLVDARQSVLGFGAELPDGAGQFWDAARFRREWLSGRPMLLVTPRAPTLSVVSTLPADSARLILVQNGRRLYAPARLP